VGIVRLAFVGIVSSVSVVLEDYTARNLYDFAAVAAMYDYFVFLLVYTLKHLVSIYSWGHSL